MSKTTSVSVISAAKGRSLALYSVHEKNLSLVLSVRGILDHREAPFFRDQIERAAFATVSGGLIVDMARVDCISSAGMRVLSLMTNNLALRDKRLIVAGLSGTVAETVAIAGVEALIETAPSVSAALARLGDAPQRAVLGL